SDLSHTHTHTHTHTHSLTRSHTRTVYMHLCTYFNTLYRHKPISCESRKNSWSKEQNRTTTRDSHTCTHTQTHTHTQMNTQTHMHTHTLYQKDSKDTGHIQTTTC